MLNKIVLPHNYIPRDYQCNDNEDFFSGQYKRFIDVWHRRAGKDTKWWNRLIAAALGNEVGTYGYILPTLVQAREVIWEGIGANGLRFIDYIPPRLILKKNESDMRIKLINGSVIKLGGADHYNAFVGGNMRGFVFSEYSFQNPLAWHYLRPILVENGGWAAFIYTFRGHNHAYDLYENNNSNPQWKCSLLSIKDTKRIDGTPVMTEEQIEEERRAGMSENLIQQEFYCVPSAMEGAYFANELLQATNEDRICNFAIDRAIPVNTYWDLGYNDSTSIWFVQKIRNEYRVISYYENNFQNLNHYINYVEEFRNKYDLVYGKHYAPHDAQHKLLAAGGKSIIQLAKELGIRFICIPRIKNKQNAIEHTRSIFGRIWLHQDNCKHGLACLRNYHANYNPRLDSYGTACHDWSSHGADAFMAIAQADRMTMKETPNQIHKGAFNKGNLFS